MTMALRLLEYQSLKAVLLHMDAGVRLQISLHMPSIQNVEKGLPLKVKHFFMNETSRVVNKTGYEVRTIRHYPDGNAPEPIQLEFNEGGSRFDFDQFGFQIASGDNVLLPGDVTLLEGGYQVWYDTDEDEITRRDELRGHEKALEILNELERKGLTVEDYLSSPEPDPFDEEIDAARWILRENPKNLSRDIEKYKLKIQSFECRRNNTKPPFTCYMQLSFWKEDYKRIQRFEYNKKLFEASKHLNEFLFGGRIMPIRVKKLFLQDCGIFRLPVGFRLQVKKAYLNDSLKHHRNLPLIMEDSINVSKSDMDSSDLIPRQLVHGKEDLLLEEIRAHGNIDVCIRPDNKLCSPEFYIAAIQAWLNEDRPVGRRIWMETGNEKIAKEVLELMLKDFEKSKRTERCITVDLSNSTVLEASYDVVEHLSPEPWMLKFHIVEV